MGGLTVDIVSLFLSTPSARRATYFRRAAEGQLLISIHALREEGDPTEARMLEGRRLFLSTPSARRATACELCHLHERLISIHALREEGDP